SLSLTAPATTELYALSLHDALPICSVRRGCCTRPGYACTARHSTVRGNGRCKRVQVPRALALLSSTPGCFGVMVSRCQSDSTKRSEEHTSELQSRENLVCRLLLEKK